MQKSRVELRWAELSKRTNYTRISAINNNNDAGLFLNNHENNNSKNNNHNNKNNNKQQKGTFNNYRLRFFKQ